MNGPRLRPGVLVAGAIMAAAALAYLPPVRVDYDIAGDRPIPKKTKAKKSGRARKRRRHK